MLGQRELTMEDYKGIIRRRRWWIMIPLLLGPLVAYGVSLLFHEQYMSETLVLVEQQKVPDSFVRSVVSEEINQRLATMQEQILSRTRLQPIIEKFGLFKSDIGKVPMEDLVARLRRYIVVDTVRTMAGTRTGGLPGFTISFTADNPRLAQQVCAEITSMFMEENLRLREQRSQGTTDFLANQLADAKQKLDEQDARLAAFKQRYIGQLPGQEQTNMGMLMGMNTQLDAVTQQLTRAQQDRAYMETLLAQQITAWQASQEATSPDTLEKQLGQLQAEMVKLEARYTPDHPDIIKAKNDIALLKKKIAEANAKAPEKPVPTQSAKTLEPPQIQQMRNQIHVLEQTIREKTREQEKLQEQIKVLQARVQLSPKVDEEYKLLTRDYDTALAFYKDLLTKENQSEMATNLERRQQGEQFRVLDPANLPGKPSFPNRPLFALGGLAGGLFFAMGLVAALEGSDKSIRSERDIEFFLHLPTLAQLPTVKREGENGHGSRRKRRKASKEAVPVAAGHSS